MEMKELEEVINAQPWTKGFRLEYQQRRMTPFELIKAHLNPVAETKEKPKGPPKLVQDLTQRELLDEIMELGTQDRVARLEREVHREIVDKAPTQWNRCEMTEPARRAHEYCLRELRKLRDKGI